MSQITETVSEKPWVLVSSIAQNAKEEDLQRITQSVIELVDEWQSAGKFIWSGPFNDNKTGMAIFEATKEDALAFYDKYGKICAGVLNHYLYQWDAMPILRLL